MIMKSFVFCLVCSIATVAVMATGEAGDDEAAEELMEILVAKMRNLKAELEGLKMQIQVT